jgi:hypothetical protein
VHEQIWTLRPTHLSSAVHPLLLPNCTQHSNSSADQCNSCRPLPRLTWWFMTSTDVRPTSESRCQANLGRDSLGHVLPLRPNCTQYRNSSADQCNSCRPLPRLTRWSMTPTDVRPTSEPRRQANLGRDSLGHVLPLRPNCTQHSNSSADQCNSCRPLPRLTRWSMTPTDVRPTY